MLSNEVRIARIKHSELPIVSDYETLPRKGVPVLYSITCTITNKIYGGVSFNMRERARGHLEKGDPTSPDLHESILEYGAGNHQIRLIIQLDEVIEEEHQVAARDYLEEKEEIVIDRLGLLDPKLGLNRVRDRVIASTGNEFKNKRYWGRPNVDRNKQIL